ncbi:hypothetical protein BKA70DRAFT_1306838, partial [Coprinopsis sp. MPI-PUGE-AT-0042]
LGPTHETVNSSNYSLAVLDAALLHLSVDALPAPNSSRAIHHSLLESAHAAIPIVALAVNYCERSKASKQATISRVLSDIDGILAWLRLIVVRCSGQGFELQRQSQQRLMVEFIRGLCSLDSLLELAVFSSRRAVELLVAIWSTDLAETSKEKNKLVLLAPSPIEFMESFVNNTDGLDLLCDMLRSSSSLAQQLYGGLEMRLLNVSALYGKGLSVTEAKRLLGLLGIITVQLTQEPDMDSLFRPAGLRHYLGAILSLKSGLTKTDILYLSDAVLQLAIRSGTHSPASELREIAKSPLIPLLADCFTTATLEWEEDVTSTALHVIQVLRTYSYQLKFLVPLWKAIQQHHTVHPLDNGSAVSVNAEVHEEWCRLVSSVYVLHATIPHDELNTETGRISPRVCDNGSHWKLWPDDDYWDECQREDWSRHRCQCKDLCHAHQLRRSDGIRYSASAQYLHQDLVLALFEDEFAELDAEIERQGSNYTVNDFILVFDGCWGVAPQALELARWDERESFGGDCPLLEAEFAQTIDRWRKTEEPTTRLMEAIFEYNAATRISLLMEIEIDKGRLLKTIVRFKQSK